MCRETQQPPLKRNLNDSFSSPLARAQQYSAADPEEEKSVSLQAPRKAQRLFAAPANHQASSAPANHSNSAQASKLNFSPPASAVRQTHVGACSSRTVAPRSSLLDEPEVDITGGLKSNSALSIEYLSPIRRLLNNFVPEDCNGLSSQEIYLKSCKSPQQLDKPSMIFDDPSANKRSTRSETALRGSPKSFRGPQTGFKSE